MDPRTSQRIYAIKKQKELDDLYNKAGAKGEKPRSRTVKYAPEGKGVKKGEKVSGTSAMSGRKEKQRELNEYLNRRKKALERIPAEKRKKMQEKTKDNNAKKYASQVNGYYQENVMTPEMYEAYQNQVYGNKKGRGD